MKKQLGAGSYNARPPLGGVLCDKGHFRIRDRKQLNHLINTKEIIQIVPGR
jgi:hypothetical protein